MIRIIEVKSLKNFLYYFLYYNILMPFFFSLLTFFLPFILISLLPKTIPETAYLIATYLIILPTSGQQTAYGFMKEIPKEASVSASYILVPHLKKPFGKIFAVPRNNEDSDYILLNHNISIPLTSASLYKQYLTSLEKNYEIVKSQNNIFLLKSTIDKPVNLSP